MTTKNQPISKDTLPYSPSENELPPETRPDTSAPEQNQEYVADAEPTSEQLEQEPKGLIPEIAEGLQKKLKTSHPKPTIIPVVKDQLTIDIEKIMEAELKEAFVELSVSQKQQFKIKGEEVAREIRDLLKSTHTKVKKIFHLILDWLRLLPGINRFFLEQEAKIKTDKIIALKKIAS